MAIELDVGVECPICGIENKPVVDLGQLIYICHKCKRYSIFKYLGNGGNDGNVDATGSNDSVGAVERVEG